MSQIPLGEASDYPTSYAPDVLFPVPRQESREALGLGSALPFVGVDIWNAWELTWLDTIGKPVVATAEITVPANSPNIVESKSLKLYLNSLAMMPYASSIEVATVIKADISRTAGTDVAVSVTTAAESATDCIADLPGECLDYLEIGVDYPGVDPGILQLTGDERVSETLHSHLFRSNCPVTHQPDMGSVLVRYAGPRIDKPSLLRYLVSFRQHNDFHEACVERMFVDVKNHCKAEELTILARFNRRGGLDINPFRSDREGSTENIRLWRQ